MNQLKYSSALPARVEVLIIGGGIQGAGIAQAAAAAGYQVLLVEKTGWGAGTSSKSSKLIHGGLRYLQQFHLGLVRESLREREILCRIAPHLVTLNSFYIPIYRDTKIRPWQLRIGLSLYALLGGLGKNQRFAQVPQRQWHNLPGLRTEQLQAVFQYSDGQSDDERLTQAVVASASQLGAVIACPVECRSATATGNGYEVILSQGIGETTVRCQVLINAAGPWSDEIASRITPMPSQPPLALIKGSHLILNKQLSRECFYLESPLDGRAVFVLPWRGQTLLGTTESPFTGDPALATCSPEEKSYLLATLAHYFPEYATAVEVMGTMAGLRVLPEGDGRIHGRSREVVIVRQLHADHGYIAVCGGKLTTYRSTAGKVVKLIRHCLGLRPSIANTAELSLPEISTQPIPGMLKRE